MRYTYTVMRFLKPKTFNLLPGSRSGVTIIEIVIALALIATMAFLIISAFNPAGLLASSRNSERRLHLQAILSAVRQNIAENPTGLFNCVNGNIPTSSRRMASASSSANYNIAPCLVPNYLDAMPFDPSASSSHYTSNSDYDSGYNILENTSTPPQITLIAPYAELGVTVSSTR
jgi:type II secretory pathway pseudopilin PulG